MVLCNNSNDERRECDDKIQFVFSVAHETIVCLAFLPARPRGSRRDVQLGAAPPVHPGDEGCAFSGALKVWAFTGRAMGLVIYPCMGRENLVL